MTPNVNVTQGDNIRSARVGAHIGHNAGKVPYYAQRYVRVFEYQHVGIGNAKCLRGPNANGFAFWYNIDMGC